MKNLFKKGQQVKVIKDNQNASDFTDYENMHYRGVYGNHKWITNIYTIEGTIKLITFTHTSDVFCAYLLNLNGKPVGYVYNIALEAIK